jgi:hypothetical protein
MEDGHIVSIPNFPAWVCDLCGRREYDPQALSQLQLIMHQNDEDEIAQQRKRSTGCESDQPLMDHRRRT